MQMIWEQIHAFAPDIDRQSAYGQAWLTGMEALGKAQEDGSTLAFRQAADAFLAALEADPERPEALMGVAYLLVLLGDELSAIHYAHAVLDQLPDSQHARELAELLESSHRLNSLLEDVERLSEGLGLDAQHDAEVLSAHEAQHLVELTELLLQIQHNLLVIELRHGLFRRLDQLNSRQRSLETLFDLLSAHLTHFLSDQNFGEGLRKRLDVLAYDLESLQNLENLFEAQRIFQKEVQSLFRELTRQIIQLRMKKANGLADSLTYLSQLSGEIKERSVRLEAFPSSLRKQVESASGWIHLQQQAEQFEELIEATKAQHIKTASTQGDA